MAGRLPSPADYRSSTERYSREPPKRSHLASLQGEKYALEHALGSVSTVSLFLSPVGYRRSTACAWVQVPSSSSSLKACGCGPLGAREWSAGTARIQRSDSSSASAAGA